MLFLCKCSLKCNFFIKIHLSNFTPIIAENKRSKLENTTIRQIVRIFGLAVDKRGNPR